MRLRRLELQRYGHLTDVALDFPSNAALIVVHGPNEAGKSTALSAIADGLFGFGHKTGFDFLHGGPQLRIGFTLTARDSAEAAFTRRKGRRDTLRDASDQAVPEEALHRFLGGASRELFEQTFGLDGDRLRAGGAVLAQREGGVGESLFAAGTGLLGLRRALARLDDEAKLLVGDGRGRRRLSEAVDAWRQARRMSEERAIQPRAWQETEAAHAAAVAALAQVQEDTRQLSAEGSRLQRVRRVAPLLIGLDAARAALAALADVPHLPPDAEGIAQRARAARQEASRDAAREAAEAERLTEAYNRLSQDQAALAAQDGIDMLAEQRAVAVQAAADLPKLRLDVASRRALVAEAVCELGIAMTPEAARDAVPAAAARHSVQRLIGVHAALAAKADASALAFAAARARRDQAEAALQASPVPSPPTLLRATTDAARGEGRIEAELDRAERLVAEARHNVGTALAALPLWQGDADALAACPVPLPAAAKAVGARLEAANQQVVAAAANAAAFADELKAVEDEVSRLSRGETMPTYDAVLAARAVRDQAWRTLRRGQEDGHPSDDLERGPLPPGPLPDVFERLSNEADLLADRRADEAQRVADYLTATARLNLLGRRRLDADAYLVEAENAASAAALAWRALWAPSGLVPEPPAAMAEWSRARAEMLKLIQAETEARGRRDDLAARRDRARTSVLALLPGVATAETLAAVLLRAEAACATAEAVVAAHKTLAEALAREEESLPELRLACEADAAALDRWRDEWAQAVPALGLVPSCQIEVAEAGLSAWGRIAEAAPAWRIDEQRIEDIAGAIASLANAARAVQAQLGELACGEPAPVAVARLTRRLAAARDAATEAKALEARIKTHEQAAAETARRGHAAEAELAALRQATGAVDDAGLEAVIEKAKDRDGATAEASRFARALINQGDGCDEDALRAETSGVDPDAAAARLTDIEAETAELGERREALSAQCTRMEALLDAMREGQDAAGAAQDAQHALAEARAIAERYARLHVARVLLRSGIDRFRQAERGPLLRAAEARLKALTGGRYVRLSVDEDAAGRLLLAAVQSDGTECPTDALSEGTRDQLYLALRIAAIEAYSAAAEPLPFIADDLLVHFDDARAAAALGILAQLGRKTQVLLFTHHNHIADMAAAQTGTGTLVVRLPHLADLAAAGQGLKNAIRR